MGSRVVRAVLGLTALVAVASVPVGAATASTSPPRSATSDGASAVLAAEVDLHGDQVVLAGGDRGGGAAAWVGEGYALAHADIGMADAYVLRPVSGHPSSGALVAPLEELAVELSLVTGATFTVGSPAAEQTSTTGEITVELTSTSPCGPLDSTVIGCGGWGESSGDDVIDFGNAWLSPTIVDDARLLRAGVGHEVGHALGLSHFTDPFQGQVQLMHTSIPDPSLRHYRSGDVRGLLRSATNGFLGGAPAAPLAPRAPEDLVAVPGPGSLDLTWTVVDQGSDVLEHEVDVRPVGAPTGDTTQTGSARAATVDGLPWDQALEVRVRARNTAGWGPWSDPAGPVTPDEDCTGPFPDVADDHPFCPDVAWLVTASIAEGYADGSFHPTAPVSRQAMAAFLRRLAETVDPDAVTGPWPGIGFPDVSPDNPFREDIAWLAATGIAGGYADGGFHPGAPVSRQAMAAFLRRLAVLLGGSEAGAVPPGAVAFLDVGDAHPFHDDVAWMRLAGLSQGTWDDACACALYRPTDAVSRQAMAAFLRSLSTVLTP